MEKLSTLKPKGFGHKELAVILNSMVDKINDLEDRVATLEAEKAFEAEIDESIDAIKDDEDVKEDVSEVIEEKSDAKEDEQEEEIIVVSDEKPKGKGKKKS